MMEIIYFALTLVKYVFVTAVLFYLLCCVFKYFLRIYLSFKHGWKIQFLDGLDAVQICVPKCINRTANGYSIIKGVPDIPKMRALMQLTIDSFEFNEENYSYSRLRLCVRQMFGYYYWLPEENFQAQNHINAYDCRPPKNQRELLEIMAHLFDTKLTPDVKSPWEFYIFPLDKNYFGLNGGPHYVFGFQIHHVLADAVAGSRFVSKFLIEDPFDQVLTDINNRIYAVSQMTLVKVFAIINMPFALFKHLVVDKNILCGPQLSERNLLAISRQVSLDRLKAVKNAKKMTVNDVLTSCITAGLRDYFLKKTGEVPKAVNGIMPISFHNLSEPFSRQLKNYCTFVRYQFPLAEVDPIKRLIRTNNQMESLKRDVSVFSTLYCIKFLANTLPSPMRYFLSNWNRPTILFSNMPGPQKPCKIKHGEDIVQMTAFVPNYIEIGICVGSISYGGQVHFTINVNTALISDQQEVDNLGEKFIEEFELLEKLIL